MFGGWGKGKKGDKNEISEAPDGGWNFDPTGFERAAKALKEINNAPNSDAALEIIKTQDATKRLEHEAAIEQGKARQLTAMDGAPQAAWSRLQQGATRAIPAWGD